MRVAVIMPIHFSVILSVGDMNYVPQQRNLDRKANHILGAFSSKSLASNSRASFVPSDVSFSRALLQWFSSTLELHYLLYLAFVYNPPRLLYASAPYSDDALLPGTVFVYLRPPNTQTAK